jgi:hypothetical protein
MPTRFAYPRNHAFRALVLSTFAALSFAAVLACPQVVRAGDAHSNAVGHIRGRDISVEDGIRTKSDDSGNGIDVSNGSVVTVHSGKARMTLLAGGKVEICGPAKFTVLLSGNAITLALNFGRVRAELPAETSLRVFTPTIVGTPIDISGGSRDITVGLSLDDSLCVLATNGAVQLEHQFSGEKIIVPEAGEFFLNSGQLLPVAGTPGTCQCFADEPGATPVAPAPEFATLAPLAAALQPRPNASRSSIDAAPPTIAVPTSALPERPGPTPEPPPALEYSVLQHANQAHPVAASARSDIPSAPPSSVPNQTVSMPALVFSSTTPLPPPGPSADTILLIREVQVSPEWQFSGHVEPPQFAAAMQHALGEKSATSSQPPPAGAQTPAQTKKKKGGFWAALRRAFGSS